MKALAETLALALVLTGLGYAYVHLCALNRAEMAIGCQGWSCGNYGALAVLVFFAGLIVLAAFVGSGAGFVIRITDPEGAEEIAKGGSAGGGRGIGGIFND